VKRAKNATVIIDISFGAGPFLFAVFFFRISLAGYSRLQARFLGCRAFLVCYMILRLCHSLNIVSQARFLGGRASPVCHIFFNSLRLYLLSLSGYCNYVQARFLG
jgi:hypothetical protein